MQRLLSLTAILFFLGCSSEDTIQTYEFSGYAFYTDERGDYNDIADHSGIKISLFLNGESVEDTLTADDGSYRFLVLDSLGYDLSFSKEQYVEISRSDRFPRSEPYYDHIPSLPIYYVEKLSVSPTEYETLLNISLKVNNYLITRYDPTYFRFFLSRSPEVSNLNYEFTRSLMLHDRAEFTTPINGTDAELKLELNFFDLNQYKSGEEIHLIVYTTTYADPFIEQANGQLIYTGLSEQFATDSFMMP